MPAGCSRSSPSGRCWPGRRCAPRPCGSSRGPEPCWAARGCWPPCLDRPLRPRPGAPRGCRAVHLVPAGAPPAAGPRRGRGDRRVARAVRDAQRAAVWRTDAVVRRCGGPDGDRGGLGGRVRRTHGAARRALAGSRRGPPPEGAGAGPGALRRLAAVAVTPGAAGARAAGTGDGGGRRRPGAGDGRRAAPRRRVPRAAGLGRRVPGAPPDARGAGGGRARRLGLRHAPRAAAVLGALTLAVSAWVLVAGP